MANSPFVSEGLGFDYTALIKYEFYLFVINCNKY